MDIFGGSLCLPWDQLSTKQENTAHDEESNQSKLTVAADWESVDKSIETFLVSVSYVPEAGGKTEHNWTYGDIKDVEKEPNKLLEMKPVIPAMKIYWMG